MSDQDQTGLYYYNARYYNPILAKFTSVDIVQSSNGYSYVSNNPIIRTDPSGYMDWVGEGEGGFMQTRPKQGIWIKDIYYNHDYDEVGILPLIIELNLSCLYILQFSFSCCSKFSKYR